MKNKSLISSIIVISIIVSLVIMFTSGPGDTVTGSPQPAVTTKENNSIVDTQADGQQEKPIAKTSVVATKSQSKVTKQTKTEKPPQSGTQSRTTANASSGDSNSRITRVSRPGMKYRIVRVKESTIPPNRELRTWSRSQWVTKVSSLQKEGEDSLAEDYIAAYNTQYPDRDLNNYLK